jgi:hypothetical protein
MTKVSFGPSYVGDQVIARVMENRDRPAYVETWREAHDLKEVVAEQAFELRLFKRA